MVDRLIRQVAENESFRSSKDRISTDAALLDEAALFGVTWVLGRAPELGQQTDSPDVWAIVIAPLRGLPELVVYYVFGDSQVDLISIEPAVSEDDEDGLEDIEF